MKAYLVSLLALLPLFIGLPAPTFATPIPSGLGNGPPNVEDHLPALGNGPTNVGDHPRALANNTSPVHQIPETLSLTGDGYQAELKQNSDGTFSVISSRFANGRTFYDFIYALRRFNGGVRFGGLVLLAGQPATRSEMQDMQEGSSEQRALAPSLEEQPTDVNQNPEFVAETRRSQIRQRLIQLALGESNTHAMPISQDSSDRASSSSSAARSTSRRHE